jgi:16S rRNA (uracil1498-N3)-methyltransferase
LLERYFMRRFYISSERLIEPRPYIEGADARHLRVVLRSQPGDRITVLDGKGNAYQARIVAQEHDKIYLDLEMSLPENPDSAPEIILAQGYLKDKKMDGLVRQLTELGVARWIPFLAGRSVPVPDQKRLLGRYERWQKISIEAVKQCGRRRPMAIAPVVPFETALDQAQECDLRLIFWEKKSGSQSRQPARMHPAAKVFVMVGPEGGFEPGEVDLARRAGFSVLGLGPRILRAETATLAAAVLIQYLFGDMSQNFLDNPQAV